MPELAPLVGPTRSQPTPTVGRPMMLRLDTRDEQVWADTFTGRYHVPPDWMPPPSSVLDLGANIGLTAADYGRLWPDAKIVAVEMDARNAALIPINAPGVDVRQVAVSYSDGLGHYDTRLPSDAFALGTSATPEGVTAIQALDGLIGGSFAGQIDFVKMDVEGAEWDLLWHPDWAPLVRHLLVELHAPARNLSIDVALDLGAALLHAAGFDHIERTRHPCGLFAARPPA